jgi:tetratricopeptide (TPR) repeat protein
MLADVKLLVEWDFAGAEREYKLALQLNPSYSTTYLWYANFLDWMGRNEEAYALLQRALQIDPVSTTVNSFLGYHFMQMRQYDKAIMQIQEVLDMEPNDAFSHSNLAYAYLGKKMFPEAIAELRKAAAGGMETARIDEAYAWALSGKPDMARRMLDELIKKAQTSYVAPSLIFRLYHALGEIDQAIAWLEKSAIEREPAILFVQSIPFTDQLRQDPRFIALMKKLGFKK